jgi:hypothetical protein
VTGAQRAPRVAARPLVARRPRPGSPWPERVGLLAVLLGTAALRLRLLDVPLERDEGEFAYMAQLILRGEVPYLAAHNMKLPGVYYAYAGILALFGESVAAIHAGLLLLNLAAIALVHRLARCLLDRTGALVAAAAYALLSLDPSVLGLAAKGEHFLVVPVLAGVLLLRAPGPGVGRVAVAGLLLGAAVVMKQHAAAFVLFGGLWLLAGGGRRDTTAWRTPLATVLVFAAAAALPFALTCAAIAAAGAFTPFWFWTVTYARQYATLLPLDVAAGQLGRQVVAMLVAAPGCWLLAAVGLAAPLWDAPARRGAWFVGLFAACSFLAVVPGLRFSEHYFIQVLPAAALLAGTGAETLVRRARSAPVATALRAAVLLVPVALSLVQGRAHLFLLSPAGVARAVYGANPFPEAIAVGRYLREHSRPEERVAVIGSEPEIYFYARRRAAVSYMYTYPLTEAQPFARRMQEDMIAQLERERPRLLVLVNVDTSWSLRPDSPRLLMEWAERAVNTDYRAAGVVDIVPGGPTVYRWDAEARDAGPRSRFHLMVFERRP